MRAVRIALIVAALAATGCTKLVREIDNEIETAATRTHDMKAANEKAVSRTAETVQHTEGLWLGRNAIRLEQREALPPVFQQPATFDRVVWSLSEFAQRISQRSGIATQVTPDALAASQRGAGGEGNNRPSNGPQSSAAPANAPGSIVTSNLGRNGTQARPVHIAYADGNLKGLLDMAATRFGVSWRFLDGNVQFYFTDTKAFQIKAIPGDTQVSASVGSSSAANGSSGGGTSGGDNVSNGRSNAQSTAVSSRLSVFESIEKSVSAMLSQYGKVVASPATGTISVTDTPEVLGRVSRFVEDENRTLSRQVMINVTVLSVAMNDQDNYGINWNLVYGDLVKRFGVRNTFATEPGSTSFSAAVLSATSKFSGSQVMIDALSSQGKVRRETSASVAALNNQPVPVQVARQTAYLKSSSTSAVALNVGGVGTPITTLEPGTVSSGFNMTILPHVLSNGTVMLQFGTDISTLRRIRTVSSNNSSIESPELDTRNFLQRVAMKSGETLVVSGFEQTDANVDRQGVGDPKFFGLGGGLKASTGKEVIVILVTPITMSGA